MIFASATVLLLLITVLQFLGKAVVNGLYSFYSFLGKQ